MLEELYKKGLKCIEASEDLRQAKQYFLEGIKLYQEPEPSLLYFKCLAEYILIEKQFCEFESFNENVEFLQHYLAKFWNEKNNIFIRPDYAQIFNLDLNTQKRNTQNAAKFYEDKITNKFQHNPKVKSKSDKIKLGYISPDFNKNPLTLALQDSFKYHNRDKFEVFAFSVPRKPNDNFTEIIKSSVDYFFEFNNNSAQELAKFIHEQEIDILVDLAGFCSSPQLEVMAYKPAPIQCSWLGYLGSTGSSAIDYFIADKHLITENNKAVFTEDILYLENSFITAILNKSYEQHEKSEYGFKSGQFVFCCFCASFKFCDKFFTDVFKILQATPNSVLWIYFRYEDTIGNIVKFAEKFNIGIDRFNFHYATNITEHWSLQVADLFLDPYVISNSTSTYLSLNVDLPVLTLAGNMPEARVSASILKSCGLDELVATSRDEYIKKAVGFYNDKQILNNLKQQINANKSNYPIFNQQGFIAGLDKAFEGVFR